jgi:hypothetical protein
MLKCKKSVYADCRRGREKNGTISIRHGQEGKGNISVTIEEFAEIVDAEIKDIKNIYSLTYKVIAIEATGLSTSRRKDAHRINNLIRGVQVRLVGENIEPGFLNSLKL